MFHVSHLLLFSCVSLSRKILLTCFFSRGIRGMRGMFTRAIACVDSVTETLGSYGRQA